VILNTQLLLPLLNFVNQRTMNRNFWIDLIFKKLHDTFHPDLGSERESDDRRVFQIEDEWEERPHGYNLNAPRQVYPTKVQDEQIN
jgi:hypothetical protein